MYREKPATLNKALTAALEHEAFKAGRQRRAGLDYPLVGSQCASHPEEVAPQTADRILGRLAAMLDEKQKAGKESEKQTGLGTNARGACFYFRSRDTTRYWRECGR